MSTISIEAMLGQPGWVYSSPEFAPTDDDWAFVAQAEWEEETGVTRKASRKGPWWQVIRRRALERDGHRCRLCNGSEHLDAHHREYAERCSEETEDFLTTLCRVCHQIYHEWIQALRNVEARA